MTIPRHELLRLYWGENCLPCEWCEVDEIARHLATEEVYLTLSEIDDLLKEYKITIRSDQIKSHRIVWNVLVNDFNMVHKEDFLYRTKLNMKDVDFLLTEDLFGIILDWDLPSNVVNCEHLGSSAIVTLSSMDFDILKDSLIEELRQWGVRKRCQKLQEGDEDAW
jgi:hypothetical protein